MSTTTKTRRPVWHPAPPPSPQILNLPRRTRRKQPKTTSKKPPISFTHHLELHHKYYRGKLESLFDQERAFSGSVPIVLFNSSERRERVEEEEWGESGCEFVEEKWRFQAEILRAECNFLRMERELALKKLERNRVQMERTLRSAVQTLVSGRKKLYEGKNVSALLEEEIEDLAEKLEELLRSSRVKDYKVQNCSNFDKHSSLLQRRLEKFGGLLDEEGMKDIRERAEVSLSINTKHVIEKESFISGHKDVHKFTDVELLRRKMEGLSKGMLDCMEDFQMASTTANSCVASSTSTSKRIEFPDSSSFSTRQTYQESISYEENKCSGRCRAIVRRIVEQVRAETEQWSQMQEMLGQVRVEIQELQASRDFWEDRALDADSEIQFLRSAVQEWRQNALTSETKTGELQAELSFLREELEKLRREQNRQETPTQDFPPILLSKQLETDKHVLTCCSKENYDTDTKGRKLEIFSEKSRIEQNKEEVSPTKVLPPISLGKQLEKEKRLLMHHRLKENHHTNRKEEIAFDGRKNAQTRNNGFASLKRSPFHDIGNSSPSTKQNIKVVFPLHSTEPSKNEESF